MTEEIVSCVGLWDYVLSGLRAQLPLAFIRREKNNTVWAGRCVI